MKITTLQENLKNGLNIVSHITSKNTSLPILNNVMISGDKGNIKLITTNLEIGISSVVRGKIEEEGIFTVDAKIISDYISLLPNKKINMRVKSNSLVIESDNYKTTINGQGAEEFPLIPRVEKIGNCRVKIKEFRDALSQVIFAVSYNETRIELSGVLFNLYKNNLVMAATDSYRLAEKKIQISSNIREEKKVIIPAKTLQELIRILSNIHEGELENENITLYFSDNQILFCFNNTELVSRIIEGQYPDYKQIIPINSKTNIIINREEFIRAVKAASIFSKTGINDINLDFSSQKNKTIISSTSGQTGENITELNTNIKGENNNIVVNYKYLLDGINNINSQEIKIKIINNNTPCLLKPFYKEKDVKNNNYSYIIMPIKQ